MLGQFVPSFSTDQAQVIFLGFVILGAVFLLFTLFLVGRQLDKKRNGICPYTNKVVRRVDDLPFESKKKILRFLYDHQDYDNRIIVLSRAVYCRETGRIFPDCVTWLDTVELDWSFIQKRHPGHYVSWGSLNEVQQVLVRDAHHSLAQFQTERSCPNPSPRAVTSEYIYIRPGPLYVDLETKTLVGWQQVPETEFEVLVVQKPQKTIRVLV